MLFAVLPAQAQTDDTIDNTPSEVELMTKRYTDSYDSLINSYYMRRLNHKHANRKEENNPNSSIN